MISTLSKVGITLTILIAVHLKSFSQTKILFDAAHGQSAGGADWVIDADQHNMNWGSSGPYTCSTCYRSNAQVNPTPAQSAVTSNTAETYWEGALSSWALDLTNRGYVVESLPYTSSVTYGNSSNTQDLANYKVYIIDEPNVRFTSAEITAIVNWVRNGGGLYMISDHNGSDRNFDGWDSPHIWKDFAVASNNVFGINMDTVQVSPTITTFANYPTDSCLHGPLGTPIGLQYHQGTTMTIDPSVNASVRGLIYSSGTSGNFGVLAACARYGKGKVAALGDSSPFDDGTGNPRSTLFSSYATDLNGSHRKLILNTTIWLANTDTGGTNGSLNVTTSGSKTICPGKNVTLTASGATTYVWNTGATTPSITVSPTATIGYTVTGTTGTNTGSNSLIVTVLTKPLSAFTPTAAGRVVTVTNQSTNANSFTISYGDATAASISLNHTYSTDGTYTITMINTNTCASDTLKKQITVRKTGLNENENNVQHFAIKAINNYEWQLSYSLLERDEVLRVYSMGSEIVYESNISKNDQIAIIPIERLSAGIYIIQLGSSVTKMLR